MIPFRFHCKWTSWLTDKFFHNGSPLNMCVVQILECVSANCEIKKSGIIWNESGADAVERCRKQTIHLSIQWSILLSFSPPRTEKKGCCCCVYRLRLWGFPAMEYRPCSAALRCLFAPIKFNRPVWGPLDPKRAGRQQSNVLIMSKFNDLIISNLIKSGSSSLGFIIETQEDDLKMLSVKNYLFMQWL